MSLPTSEFVPDETTRPVSTRRRRGRRPMVSMGSNEKAAFLDTLARSTLPSFDFFLFSLLAGAIIAAGILFNSPTLFFLGALTAPFFAPLIGLSLSSVLGSGWYFLQTLIGTLLGSSLVFLAGMLAGLASPLLPQYGHDQALIHTRITWIDFLVLALGMLLSTISLVRSDQKPILPSAILAYELYLPIGIAGYGLSLQLSGVPNNLWPSALITFLLYLSWTILIGIIALWFTKIRPHNFFGFLFGFLIIFIFLGIGFGLDTFHLNLNSVGSITPTAATSLPGLINTSEPTRFSLTSITSSPTSTLTASPEINSLVISSTPTHTLVPSATFTQTLTPDPTPVWAIVNASDGAWVREEPDYNSKVVDSVLGGSLVQVLPDSKVVGGVIWAHVITNSNIEGWIVQSVLVTATPMPTW